MVAIPQVGHALLAWLMYLTMSRAGQGFVFMMMYTHRVLCGACERALLKVGLCVCEAGE